MIRNPYSTSAYSTVRPYAAVQAPFVITLGESTAEGARAQPAITPQWSVPAGWMAIGGVRPADGGPDMAADWASITPIFSQVVDGGGGLVFGETPDCGALIAFGQAWARLGRLDIAITAQKYIVANKGIAGKTIAELMDPANYDLIVAVMQAFWDFTVAAGLSTRLCAINMAIGQNDMNQGTTKALFKSRMVTFHSMVNASWTVISGQADDAPMIFLTVGSFNDTGNNLEIPKGMIELADENAGMINAGPTYVIIYSDPSGVHYANDGTKDYGYLCGFPHFLWTRNQKWSAPTIDTLVRDGASVRLNFRNVYAPPLQFKTDWVTDPGDYGFLLMQGDEARSVGATVVSGVFTEGTPVSGYPNPFTVGMTTWACAYTGAENLPVACTIVSAISPGVWQLSDPAANLAATATIIGQTVVDINTPTITGAQQVTLTTANGDPVPAGWVVSYATRGTRAAGPTTGSRGNLCDSTEFAITNQNPAFTIRGFAQIIQETLT